MGPVIVVETQEATYENETVGDKNQVDYTVICALTVIEYTPASASELEFANVIVLSESVIRERLGPATLI